MTSVTCRIADGVGRIELNRPDQGNAIDMQLAVDLLAAAQACADDAQVRCVVLSAAGRMFCVGGDIGSFAAAGDAMGSFLKALADKLHEAVLVLSTMDKPLVVVVHGPAAGAGLSLVALGDIVLAAESSHFTAAYTGIGVTPDGGMSWLLPRLVGMRAAQEMILTNRRVSAAEAVTLGLVTRTVATDALAGEAEAIAARLVAAPTRALGGVRKLLLEGQNRTLAAQLDAEATTIAAAADGPEGREGITAFLSKRKPDYRSV